MWWTWSWKFARGGRWKTKTKGGKKGWRGGRWSIPTCSWFPRNQARRRGQTVISTNYTRNCVRGWGWGGGAGKLRRGPWDLFDREVRYLQRESLSSDITDAEAFSHVSLFLFPLLAKLFEFPFKKRACRVTELCSKRGTASFLVPCLFRVGRRGFVCVRRVIRNFPGSVYTLYHRFSELWQSFCLFSPLFCFFHFVIFFLPFLSPFCFHSGLRLLAYN